MRESGTPTSPEEVNKELKGFKSMAGSPDLTTAERAMDTPDKPIEVVDLSDESGEVDNSKLLAA